MLKFFRRPTEIDRNSARIDQLHSEMKAHLATLPRKAIFVPTPEFKSKQDEFVRLIERNLELRSITKK